MRSCGPRLCAKCANWVLSWLRVAKGSMKAIVQKNEPHHRLITPPVRPILPAAQPVTTFLLRIGWHQQYKPPANLYFQQLPRYIFYTLHFGRMAGGHDHDHFHHRFHNRNIFAFGFGGPIYDYAGSCWSWVPTRYGWQWAYVCGDYYGY